MPPSMNGSRNEALQLNKEDVSEGAIILLYEVIERARTALDLSAYSRTLFDIYKEVLREHRIEIEDDNVPLRIIARLSREAREDEGLVQRFKRVMGDIGFDVEYDEEGEGFEFTSQLEGISTAVEAPTPAPARRGSLDSLLDGSADKVAGTMDVGRLPYRSRKSLETTGHSDIGTWWQKRRSRSAENLDSQAQPQFRTARQNGRQSREPVPGRNESRSIPRDRITGAAQFGDSDWEDGEHTGGSAEFDDSHVYIPGVNAPIPSEQQRFEPEPFRPSDTRLLDDAEDFEQQHLHSLLRLCIRKWRERTQEQLERNERMMAVAVRYDHCIQFRNVKEDLLREAQKRRSIRETDHFFIRLEDRAARARNLFLLTKAFTHWAKSAEDEVQRTSVARRHILRTRFFNGWREITAVNEMKVQHFVLGTFLQKWRRRLAAVREREDQAVQVHENDLQRKYYKVWFFQFCEIAAPAWHNARLNPRLKRATFQRWKEATTMWSERNAWAVDLQDQSIKRRLMQTWQQKAAALRALEPQAEELRRRKLLTNVLAAVQRHSRFAPILSAFQIAGDATRLDSKFHMWKHTAELSRQAKTFDRLRILRNAWTAWNDGLRVKALEERINDRVLVESMYKWSLASRVSLFQRVHDRTLRDKCFSTWVAKRNLRIEIRNDRQNRLDAAEARFTHFKRTQLLRICLGKIEVVTAGRRAEQAAMTVQYDIKLKQRIFDQLVDKHYHLQHLNKQAGDAQYYVLTTHTLKKWREATQHARRNRRREAYAQVRRTVKINLVRKTFELWRAKAETVVEHHRQADAMLSLRTTQDAQTLLAHWRDRSAAEQLQIAQAEEHYDAKIEARFFGLWRERLNALDEMSSRAEDFLQIGVGVTAASCLKKLVWEGWEIRLRTRSAAALHERHFKQHISAMIKFWHQQTVARVAARPSSPSPISRPHHALHEGEAREPPTEATLADTEQLFDEDVGDETRRLEGWTEFDQSALDLSFSISPQNERLQPSFAPPQAPRSPMRPTPRRPSKTPVQRSALRSALRRPALPPIPQDLELGNDVPDATSTPMPQHLRAGYLKTPSKRSVIQHKRSEIQTSPQKSFGAMSAPPAAGLRDVPGFGGVRSFGVMLKESGFEQDNGKKRGRVGFGNVRHIE